MGNSEDHFRRYFQKIAILRFVQQFSCGILIGGRRKIYTDSFFEATNIRRNAQNESWEFEGLIQKNMSKKPFINQEISYINFYGEMNLSTVYDYIRFFSII